MLLKKCPRCGGDLFIEHDVGSVELVCLQCGRRQPIDHRWPLSKEIDLRKKREQGAQEAA